MCTAREEHLWGTSCNVRGAYLSDVIITSANYDAYRQIIMQSRTIAILCVVYIYYKYLRENTHVPAATANSRLQCTRIMPLDSARRERVQRSETGESVHRLRIMINRPRSLSDTIDSYKQVFSRRARARASRFRVFLSMNNLCV